VTKQYLGLYLRILRSPTYRKTLQRQFSAMVDQLLGTQQEFGTSDFLLEPLVCQESISDAFAEQTLLTPRGWPTTPQALDHSSVSIVLDVVVDVILLTLSIIFLAFSLTIRSYDHAPTEQNPRMTSVLLGLAKYVSRSIDSSRS
jgi:hypothetical protein